MADEIENIDTRFTPAFHPATIRNIDGYDDENVGSCLGQAESVFDSAYSAISDIHDAKEAAATNPSLTEGGRLLQVDDYARARMSKVTASWDRVSASTAQTIAFIEGELSAPIVEKASRTESIEIRAHAKAMNTGERLGFIQRAINEGDEITVSALLGARHFLSGIASDEMSDAFKRQWHEKANPVAAKRLRALSEARDMLNNHAGKVLVAWQDAVGFIEQTKEVRHGNTTKTMVVGKLYASDIRKQTAIAQKPFTKGL